MGEMKSSRNGRGKVTEVRMLAGVVVSWALMAFMGVGRGQSGVEMAAGTARRVMVLEEHEGSGGQLCEVGEIGRGEGARGAVGVAAGSRCWLAFGESGEEWQVDEEANVEVQRNRLDKRRTGCREQVLRSAGLGSGERNVEVALGRLGVKEGDRVFQEVELAGGGVVVSAGWAVGWMEQEKGIGTESAGQAGCTWEGDAGPVGAMADGRGGNAGQTLVPLGAAGRGEPRTAGGLVVMVASVGHSLAVQSDGTAWAWGSNLVGQLGDGTRTDRTVPVQVSGLSDVVAVAAGYGHSLALTRNGTVWAWGNGAVGQLGTGLLDQRLIPTQVSGLNAVVEVAAGLSHSLALRSDGTLWAWGSNSSGQIGEGTLKDRSVPGQVRGLSGVAAMAAGDSHSLAVKGDGTVWAWGDNTCGELGDGTTTRRLTPVQVSGLDDVVAVAAGSCYSLALKNDGTVWAWGGNLGGQLGDGTTNFRFSPVKVSGLGEVVAIAAGATHNLALKKDGTVWAWGNNDMGQLGDGTATSRLTPVQVRGLNRVVAVAAGWFHSLAARSDGTVWAWGANMSGQLGDGSTVTRSLTPVLTLLRPPQPQNHPGIAALPQLAFGGGWQTSLYFYNSTAAEVSFSVHFKGPDGQPLPVPLDGGIPVTSREVTLAAGASALLLAPNRGSLVQGWVETALPVGVGGHAVFRQTVAGRADQEAVVLFVPVNSRQAHFVFDEERTTTGIAIVNAAPQASRVSITAYDSENSVLGTTDLDLDPKSRRVAVLKDLPGLSGISRRYGRVAIETSSGAVSVIGLRFAGEAFTSIPVFHQIEPAPTRVVLPQLAFGGYWNTEIYFANTTNQAVSLPVRFFGDDGSPLNVPLLGLSQSKTHEVILQPGATVRLVTAGGPDLIQGWAEADVPAGVIGHAVFRQSVPGRAEQEAVVPLTRPDGSNAEFSFDDIGLTTTMAVLNPANVPALISISSISSDGGLLGTSQISLPPRAKRADIIRDLPEHSGVSGKRGRMLLTAQGGAVAVLGFRFGGEAFTSIPVRHQ